MVILSCSVELWVNRCAMSLGTLKTRKELEKKGMLARPERFELPTSWFVARHSIQLSYGRVPKMLILLVFPAWLRGPVSVPESGAHPTTGP
jgi:hypothetical protein